MLEKLTGSHIVDLCWHLPHGLIDRRYAPQIADAQPGVIATLTVRVVAHRAPANRRMPYKVICEDETGKLELVFFHAHADYLTKNLPVGEVRVVSGKLETFGNGLQITHPDHIGTLAEIDQLKTVEAVYPLTAGLTLKSISKSIAASLQAAPELAEWIDPSLVKRENWAAWRPALLAAHAPRSENDILPAAPARMRLAYDELLANQLALAIMRREMRHIKGRSYAGDGSLARAITAHLAFQLTGAQQTALAEIGQDMKSDNRMLRLVQGDVGSGKTVVALLAMAT
ncbi:MAG: ATP-dependent DNA helicase RecG, partial [Rhodospirillales bacterium]|nr:ATP-dependent DNA helicase RecG [Rhodospirillales bacterium]